MQHYHKIFILPTILQKTTMTVNKNDFAGIDANNIGAAAAAVRVQMFTVEGIQCSTRALAQHQKSISPRAV